MLRIWNTKVMLDGWRQFISKTVSTDIGGLVVILRECSLLEQNSIFRSSRMVSESFTRYFLHVQLFFRNTYYLLYLVMPHIQESVLIYFRLSWCF